MVHLDMKHGNDNTSNIITVFALLLLLVLSFSLIGVGIIFLLGKMQGFDLQTITTTLSENSPLKERNFVRLVTLINHITSFLLPALILSYIFYKKKLFSFLKLNISPKTAYLLGSIVLIIVAFPIAQYTYDLNKQIPFPDWIIELENSTEDMIKGLLVMNSPLELLFNILIIGLIPAIGEELIFRGIVQQTIENKIPGKPVLAIWITAIIFSAIHFQFLGFFPRMILGALLGYLFYWTRNLWVSITAHFVNNSFQVLALYFFADTIPELAADSSPDIPFAVVIISVIFVVAIGAGFNKIKEKNTII